MRVDDQKEVGLYALGDYCIPPAGESDEDAKLRRAGGLFTLAEARDERSRLRALVKSGINPVHQRKLDKIKVQAANAETLENLVDEWLATKDWAEITRYRRRQLLECVAQRRTETGRTEDERGQPQAKSVAHFLLLKSEGSISGFAKNGDTITGCCPQVLLT